MSALAQCRKVDKEGVLEKRKWFPQAKKRTPGLVGLARAVLLLAVRDATGNKDKRVHLGARRFFRDDRTLGIYCELAGWDADYIRENVERLNNGEAG